MDTPTITIYRRSKSAKEFVSFVGEDTFPVWSVEPTGDQKRKNGKVFEIDFDNINPRTKKRIALYWKRKGWATSIKDAYEQFKYHPIVVPVNRCRLNHSGKKQ